MSIPVSKIAFHHTVDIDERKHCDAREIERLAMIVAERAKDALKSTRMPGYDELHHFILAEVISSMQVTHRTIIKILSVCKDQPETVDTLTLARTQLEGLYNFSLMLEAPEFVDRYLKDGWRKRYVDFLLQREEMKDLPRFDHFNTVLAPQFLAEGREHYRITDAEKATIDNEELGIPLPSGLVKTKIKRFPTPGDAVKLVGNADRRRMLERLHPEYADLSSFTHGLPHANLLRGLLDARSLHRTLFTEEQAKEAGTNHVTDRAFIISILGLIQCAAEITEKYPGDVNLKAGLVDAWEGVFRRHPAWQNNLGNPNTAAVRRFRVGVTSSEATTVTASSPALKRSCYAVASVCPELAALFGAFFAAPRLPAFAAAFLPAAFLVGAG